MSKKSTNTAMFAFLVIFLVAMAISNAPLVESIQPPTVLPRVAISASTTQLSVVYVGNTMIDLEWTQSTLSNFVRYEIYRDDQPIQTITNRATTFYRNDGLIKGTTYNYKIREYYYEDQELKYQTSNQVSAQTGRVSGIIKVNTTWTSDTYLITDDVYIPPETFLTETKGIRVCSAATLTIESGANVKFSGYLKIEVKGTLNATGATFTSASATSTDGTHILFMSGSGGALNSCVVEYATYGIWCGSSPQITNCTVRYNKYIGININAGSPTISGCIVENNGTVGIQAYNAAAPTITNSSIINNGQDGITVGPSVGSPSNPTITNCDIFGNLAYGIHNYEPVTINATNNYWCSPLGPRASGNPSGKGDRIYGNVNYSPWLTEYVNVPCAMDLSVSKILVVQAIENGKLIAGKETAVRVFVDTGGVRSVSGVNARLYVDGVAFDPVKNNKTIYGDVSSYSAAERINCEDTFNFNIGKLTAGSHTLRAVIDPEQNIEDKDRLNNEMTANITVNETSAIRIMFRPIISSDYPNTKTLSAFMGEANTFFVNTYPISPSDFHAQRGHPYEPTWVTYLNLQLCHYLNESRIIYNLCNDPDIDFLVGVTPEGYLGSGVGGVSYRFARRAPLVSEDSAESLAHEIGHFYGLDDEYSGTIEEWWTGESTIGKWIQGYTIYDGTLRKLEYTLSDQQRYINFMGLAGATGTWVDASTYNTLYRELAIGEVDEDPRILFISGVVYENDAVDLNLCYLYEAAEVENVESGGYSVRCLASDNSVLSEVSFAASFEDIGLSPFALLVPCPQNTARVVIAKGSTTLKEIVPSTNAPSVSIVSPAGGESLGGTYEITWSASDLDGDDLSYTLLYSNDGNNWTPIAIGLDEENFSLDLGNVAGGTDCLIKVVATDGFNTTEAVSNSFSVSAQGPSAAVVIPENNSTVALGTVVYLQGYAYDMEDGEIDNSMLSWASSVDGSLGTGSYLALSNLSEGVHEITLTATDSSSSTGIATIKLSVVGDTAPPTISAVTLSHLTVAPGQTISISASISDDVGVNPYLITVTVDNTIRYLSYDKNSGLYKGTIQAPSNPGSYVVKVSAMDTIGNSENSEEIVLTVGSGAEPTSLLESTLLLIILAVVVVGASLATAILLMKRRKV